MQKVQKTYTPEFKREAVRLVQTSGKSIAQVARPGHFRYVHPSMAQGADGTPSPAVGTRPLKKRKYVASSANWTS